jgi:RimJ/RimL family protein N-acetyltransferase
MSGKQVSIREVDSTDFYRVTQHYFEFYDEIKQDPSFGLPLLLEKPSLIDEMPVFTADMKAIGEGNAVGLVAESEGALVGYCYVARRRPGSPVSHRGGLELTVKKAFRGKGIGTKLLKEMIRRCKGRFEIIELEVFAVNLPAKRLYERIGFKTYGLRPNSVKSAGKYFDEELMYLPL